ncbi:MAG: response regulator [Desulfobulbaceae bacterium]|nr:response regulator [Desulfobulbaceae bacterium]
MTVNQRLTDPVPGYIDVEEGDYAVLSVSDNGTGIRPANLNKIFEPFFTEKEMKRSGTGLGLAVVWGTVEDHNGYIDVQSVEGSGTTFTIYLPATKKDLPINTPIITLEEYMGNGESVLVVDDTESQREIASGILQKLGYNVDIVASGEDAIQYLHNRPTDLLILDMIMPPGIDGLETYLRALHLNQKQKAIITSGFSETARVQEAKKVGAAIYISKPYTMEKIGLAVKKVLNQ